MTGTLRIKTTVRNGKSILKDAYCTSPFKLGDITEDKTSDRLHLMLMNSSPGILDNDDYKIEIDLDEGSHLQLTTQSYQRIFQMKTGARQEMEVRMNKGSSFVFLPHPAVPHQCSSFSSKTRYHLSDHCLLMYGEVLSCGRKLNGEIFKFSKYHSVTEIVSAGRLIVKENLLAAPALINANQVGQLEGYTHQASFTCVSDLTPVNALIDSINDRLQYEVDICFGISALPGNGFNIRVLGNKAEQLYHLHNSIASHVTTFGSKKLSNKITAYAK